MRISRFEKAFNHIVLTLAALFSVLPLVGVLFSSLTPAAHNDGGLHIPDSLSFGNYGKAWVNGHFSTYMLTSVIVTVGVLILTLAFSVPAGFAFARMNFRGARILYFVLLVGLLLPEEAFIIPLYFNMRSMGLTNSYLGLILPQTAQSIGFGVFWLRNHFRSYPTEIIEAARVDGASDGRLLWRVLVPSSGGAIATLATLVTMWTWNEFLIPLVLVSEDQRRTAPLGLAFFQGQHTAQYSMMAAASVIIAAPIVVLYLVLQRNFINGIASGPASR